jgi:hypothetical protein
MKLFMIVLIAVTLPVSLLILVSRVRSKSLKSSGASRQCFDEELLGCDASVV